jgi:nucleoside-diphosphate-sugar epimerase
MKVLITGHKGFIGQNLLRELRTNGHDVAGVDILGSETASGNARFELDLLKEGAIAAALDAHAPEIVVHLAAQVGRVLGEDDLRHTVRENAEMTTVLAQACGQRGVRVLYSSSSEVYGDHGGFTCNEATRCLLPHNLYGLSKRWGEEVLRLYAPTGLQIVRLSMPYGPGAPPGRGRRALDNILWQAHHGMQIPIHKGAERSWCWIGDIVRGIRLVLEHGEQHSPTGDPPSPSHGVYNIGRDDAPIPMHALALTCCELAEADAALVDLIEPPTAQTVVKRLATAKLRGLGWEPTVGLDEGLPQVLEWVKQYDSDGHRAIAA